MKQVCILCHLNDSYHHSQLSTIVVPFCVAANGHVNDQPFAAIVKLVATEGLEGRIGNDRIHDEQPAGGASDNPQALRHCVYSLLWSQANTHAHDERQRCLREAAARDALSTSEASKGAKQNEDQ